jgi:5'-nucleotidase
MAYDYVLSIPKDQQNEKRNIRTFTGLYVNPLDLRAEDICIEDIAHHLSIINRYTGASPEPFSVAQHSVMGTEYFYLPEMKLAFLLHDAAEAYFNDIASPVKHDPRMEWYRELEHEAGRMIFQVFGLNPGLLAATKLVDDAMFQREVESWWGTPLPGHRIHCWPARRAELEFLEMFRSLK